MGGVDVEQVNPAKNSAKTPNYSLTRWTLLMALMYLCDGDTDCGYDHYAARRR